MIKDGKFLKTAIVIENREREAIDFSKILVSMGYKCEYIVDAKRGKKMLLENDYDLAIIDQKLGDYDGLDIIRKARERKLRTFLFCVSRRMYDEKVAELFDAGGGDFLRKPFDEDVLMAYLRKDERLAGISDIVAYRSVVVDRITRVVTCHGMELDLQPRQIDMLLYLLDNRGRILRYREISEGISGGEMSDSAVKQQGFRIRDELFRCGESELIVTTRNVGYGIM